MDKDKGRHSGRKSGSGVFFFGHELIAKLYVSKLYKRVTYISSSYTSISTAPEHHSGGLQQPFGGQISLTAYSQVPLFQAALHTLLFVISSRPLSLLPLGHLTVLPHFLLRLFLFCHSSCLLHVPTSPSGPPALCSLGGEILTQVQGCLGWCPAFWQAFVNATAASPPPGS